MITNLLLCLAGNVTVEMPDRVEVVGTEILVGDVADVRGDDTATVERVSAVSLGYAPAPGYSRLISRELITQALARRVGGVDVEFKGHPHTRVVPAEERITAATLVAEARRVLGEHFAGADAHLEPSGATDDIVVPRAREGIVLRPSLREHEQRPGAWSVPVEVLIDGEVYRTVWTSWTVELWRRREVLRRDVAAGEVLRASDFQTKRVRVGAGPERSPLAHAAFGHAVARRAITAGSVVTDRDVERVKVLSRGDSVSLEIRRGGVCVRALAIAQSDARIGDRVRVLCERTGKEMTAVVVSKELVQLRIR